MEWKNRTNLMGVLFSSKKGNEVWGYIKKRKNIKDIGFWSGITLISLFFLTGCYTKFMTLETGQVSSIEEQKHDTVMINPDENCYWYKTRWGTIELKCFKDYFPRSLHTFYNRPWWYDDDFLFNQKDCHCPYHIIYNPNCEYCWYVCQNSINKKDTLVIIHDTIGENLKPKIDKAKNSVPGTGRRPGSVVPGTGRQIGSVPGNSGSTIQEKTNSPKIFVPNGVPETAKLKKDTTKLQDSTAIKDSLKTLENEIQDTLAAPVKLRPDNRPFGKRK